MASFVSAHPLEITCRKNLHPPRLSIVCRSAPAPPNSVDSTVSIATEAISKAIQDGHKRILINAKIPGLNSALEQNFPFSSSLLSTLSKALVTIPTPLKSCPSTALLFPSSGAAAAAAAQFSRDKTGVVDNDKQEDGHQQIWTSSYAGRDTSEKRTSPHANLIINPVTFRGDPIMDALEAVLGENPDAIWLLLNPELGFDRAAVGMKESARRASFEASFTNVFYYRPLFVIERPKLNAVELGALMFQYGGPWKVYALVDDEYTLGDQFEQMPTEDQVSRCIKRCEWEAQSNQPKNRSEPKAGFDIEFKRFFGF